MLPGAGLTEIHLAAELDHLAQLHMTESSGTAVALRAVATCFKDAAASLTASGAEHQCPSASAAGTDMIDEATLVLQRWKESDSLPSGMVFDAEFPKRSCIMGAMNLAGILLRLGRCLDFRTTPLG